MPSLKSSNAPCQLPYLRIFTSVTMLLSHTAPPVQLAALRPCKPLSQGCISARTSKPLPRLACGAARPAKVRLHELLLPAVQQALLQSALLATFLSPFEADSTLLHEMP